MTIASEANRSGPYACNGATTSFPYEFRIYDAAHIRVILTDPGGTETALALGTDYTVSDVGDSGGGAVEMAVAYAAGYQVTLILNVPFTQDIDLENQGAYFAETIERAIDLQTQMSLQLKEQVARAVVLPVTSSVSVDRLTGAVLALSDIQPQMLALVPIAGDIETVAGIAGAVVAAKGHANTAAAAAGVATGKAAEAAASAGAAGNAAMLADQLANAAPETPVGSGYSARHWAAMAQALADGFDLGSYSTTEQIAVMLEDYVDISALKADGTPNAPVKYGASGEILAKPSMVIDGNASTVRGLNFRTSGALRWRFRISGTGEPGANEGTDLSLRRHMDDGSEATVFTVPRATGVVDFAQAPTVAGAPICSGVPIGSVIFMSSTVQPEGGYLAGNGAAVSKTTYAALDAAMYVGDANNASAPVWYRCTNSASPSTTRSTIGEYIVLPDLRGVFPRFLDDGKGYDGSRVLGSYQADMLGSHSHTVPTQASSGSETIFSRAGPYGSTTTATSAVGGAETRPKNIALRGWIKY